MPRLLERPTQIEACGRYHTRKIAALIGRHKGYIWDRTRVETRRASSRPGDKERRRAKREGQTRASGFDKQHQDGGEYKVSRMWASEEVQSCDPDLGRLIWRCCWACLSSNGKGGRSCSQQRSSSRSSRCAGQQTWQRCVKYLIDGLNRQRRFCTRRSRWMKFRPENYSAAGYVHHS